MEKTNIRAYTLQELANVLVQHGEKSIPGKTNLAVALAKGSDPFRGHDQLVKRLPGILGQPLYPTNGHTHP